MTKASTLYFLIVSLGLLSISTLIHAQKDSTKLSNMQTQRIANGKIDTIANLIFQGVSAFTQGLSSNQDSIQRDSIELNNQLIRYSQSGNIDSVLSLIRKGANPSAVGPSKVSALMYAVEAQHTDVVKILLHNGADPNKQPWNGFSAIMHASFIGDFENAYSLARYGARLDLQDRNGATALHYAVYGGSYEIVDMLLFYKANVNAKAKDGNTPLHIAMYMKDTSLTSLLLHHGAYKDAVNQNGYTPLMLAAQENNMQVLDFLLNNKASTLIEKDSTYTALSIAILLGNDSAFTAILNKTPVEDVPKHVAHRFFLQGKYVQRRDYRKALHKKGLRRGFMPARLGYSIQSGFTFNGGDFFFRHELAVLDYRYNTKLGLGISHRPARKAILLEAGENAFYQVYEKKQFLDLNLQKRFNIIKDPATPYGFGIYVDNRFQLALGKYVGLEKKLEKRFFYNPSIGAYMHGPGFMMGIGYSYTPYDYIEMSNHKMEIFFTGIIETHSKIEKHYPNWL